mmetsp:Transcript_2002/g.4656  ORF Transcript_2002/g.4656 Transcript_2002/m.4656 type:complete len:300 (+) Transcript_2002:226-1125(+)|eukprot:g17630.t1
MPELLISEQSSASGSSASSSAFSIAKNARRGQKEEEEEDDPSAEDAATRKDFTFHYLPEARFRMWTDRGFQMLLTKWGFGDSMCVGKWRFEEKVETRDQARELVASFFRNDQNRAALQALGVSVLAPRKLQLDIADISTAETSMCLFQKLEDCGAIGASGHIKGRLDEYVGDIIVNSLIREVFYMEESDLYDTYTEKERKEFILRIFQHLQIGGATNQYEDDVSEYMKATKALYRDLVSVRKREDGEPEVTSMVFQVLKFEEGGGQLFKREHSTNFCYMIVDAMLRHITMWKFAYDSAW